MTTYLFQVILFQAIFLVVYGLLLRKETFYTYNRIYLLATPVLAFVLPFLKMDWLGTTVKVPDIIQHLPAVFVGEQSLATMSSEVILQSSSTPSINWSIWLMLLYVVGLGISVIFLLKKYLSLNRYFRFKRKEDNSIITLPNSDVAFTFLNTIFIGEKLDETSKKQILEHETVHLKERHGLDLMFFELLKIILWFNPAVYLYQSYVSELHEFIADKKASAKAENKSYYNQLLNTAFGTENISFINTFFNHSLIKKRIVMLHKQSKTISKFKYLLLIPLFAGMITYVSCSTDNEGQNQDKLTLEEQIADLRATIDQKGEITAKDQKLIGELLDAANRKMEGTPPPPPAPPRLNSASQGNNNVPFAVIEEVPVFPGCEGLDNDARKKCMSNKISSIVAENFDTSLGKKLGLTGVNRVYVRFKIDENGSVTDIESRAKMPELETEAIRTIKLLPQMKPGKQKGENVGVLYSLPIVFQVAE